MINRRKFINAIASAFGVAWLLPFTKTSAGAKDGKSDVIVGDATRTFEIKSRYLNFPVKVGASKQGLKLLVGGEVEHEFVLELVDTKPDWWAFIDVSQFQGKSVTLQLNKPADGFKGLSSIVQANKIIDAEDLYQEARRPQFHFSSRRGWLNDPNGLVYYKGEYHLFYQHTPYSWKSIQKYWGHAVSTDLVHWTELPPAIYPDEHGSVWSGSSVIDWNNTAGFKNGNDNAMVAMFTITSKSFTQGLAFSHDRGRTWEKYQNNPVLSELNAEDLPQKVMGDRDPKVIWYAPENKWVMVLYFDRVDLNDLPKWNSEKYKKLCEEKNSYGFFSSPDLKQWKKMSEIKLPGDKECPEFFEIEVNGNPEQTRWILYGANGLYFIGNFDGKAFNPESGPHAMQYGDCFYASQTFNNVPKSDGRRILVSWGRNRTGLSNNMSKNKEAAAYKGMPFNQMMGLPIELTLKETEEGLRLYSNPVEELKSLRQKPHVLEQQIVRAGDNPLANISEELIDIETEISPGDASVISFNLRGIPITYDVQKQELSCEEKSAPLKMQEGKIRLQIMVDRTSIDIFGNDGRLYMPMGMVVPEKNHSLAMTATGGEARIHSMNVFRLKSIWQKKSK